MLGVEREVRLHLMEEALARARHPQPDLRRRQQLGRRGAHRARQRDGGQFAQHLRHANWPEAW